MIKSGKYIVNVFALVFEYKVEIGDLCYLMQYFDS